MNFDRHYIRILLAQSRHATTCGHHGWAHYLLDSACRRLRAELYARAKPVTGEQGRMFG